MSVLKTYLNMGYGGLFLFEEAYAGMREAKHPVRNGLTLIILVGAIIAAFTFVGQVLEWSTTPDLTNVKGIILDELSKMDFYTQMQGNPQALQSFQQTFDTVYDAVMMFTRINLATDLANIIVKPLLLALQWLVYGVVIFVFARMLGGQGNLGQTLGCTALAVAPQMLNVLNVFPYVQVGGLMVWGLVCTYQGVKVSGKLSPWRAFWATMLPLILLAILVLVVGAVVISSIVAQTSGGAS